MAAQQQTLNSFASWLKEDWLPWRREKTYYQSNFLRSKIRKAEPGEFETAGKQLIVPIQKQRNQATGARALVQSAAAGYLPEGDSQRVDQFTFTPKLYTGTLKIAGAAMALSSKKLGVQSNLLQFEMDGLSDDMDEKIERDMFLDGTGSLATVVSGTSGAATFVVGSTQYLFEGQDILISDNSNTNVTATIDSINRNTNTVTITGTLSRNLSTSDIVYDTGAISTTDAATRNNGLAGLALAISESGTYGGVNRATAGNAWAKAKSYDGTAGLSIALMVTVMNEMRARAGGKLGVIVTSQQQWEKYANLLYPNQVWVNQVKKYDAGWQTLEFFGVEVGWSRDCPYDRMYFMDLDTWALAVVEELRFIDEDGQMLRKVGSGTTSEWAFEANMLAMEQMVCTNPKKNSVITNLPYTLI